MCKWRGIVKRNPRTVLTLIGIFLMLWGILLLVQPPHTLTDRQQLITSGRSHHILHFEWLNDHEVLYSETDSPTLVRWNTQTRTPSAFPVPQELAPLIGRTDLGTDRLWTLSPNGKLLMWSAAPTINAIVQDVNSGRILAFTPLRSSPDEGLAVYWRADSAGLVQSYRYDDKIPVTVTTYELPPLARQSIYCLTLPNCVLPDTVCIVGGDTSGDALVLGQVEAKEDIRIALFPARLPFGSRRPIHLISFPSYWHDIDCTLSPRSDRILWTWQGWHRGGFPEWTPSWMRGHGSVYEYETSIYVSGADGSDLHEVGHDLTLNVTESPGSPQWIPGGKAISFLRGGSLYTLPVP